ncbi:MAG: DUF951 domain-containing protein [Firmicutes bacterium]|nr:DUF951 domain-containing protein [Bacillota bacterium]
MLLKRRIYLVGDYAVGDKVRMKKMHPCGNDVWSIIRVGMDFRIKCIKCGRSVMIPRVKFEKSVRQKL